MPDCTISRMPYGSSTRSIASSLSGRPVTSIVSGVRADVDDLRAEQLDDLQHVAAGRLVGAHLDQQQLALDGLRLLELDDLEHVDQLVELLGDLLERRALDVDDDRDARDLRDARSGPTASDSMLKPRRANRPATRVRTPGLFSTSTDSVCVVDIAQLLRVEGRADVARGLDVVVAGAGGHHRPHHRVRADGEVDDDGCVVDRHRLLDRRVDVGRASRSAGRRSRAPRPA